MTSLLTAVYVLLAPLAALWLVRSSRIAAVLGPVIFAYLAGALLSLLAAPAPQPVSLLRDLSIPLAIPLLLFTLDVRGWLRDAGRAALSLGLSVVALLLAVSIAWLLIGKRMPHGAENLAMLTAMFSGGAPNAAAVHGALGSAPEVFLRLNASDIICGGSWFLLLVSIGPRLFGLVLKTAPHAPAPALGLNLQREPRAWWRLAGALALSALIVAVSAGLSMALTGGVSVAVVMLALTSLAIAVSFWPALRQASLSYPAGYYLVLVFCCAIGAQVDLALLSRELLPTLALTAGILLGTVGLHLLLARLAGIDRDTFMITSTAAIYGAPFVPPVANALGNPAMLLSGLTTSLVGYALGNYLGLAVAWQLGLL